MEPFCFGERPHIKAASDIAGHSIGETALMLVVRRLPCLVKCRGRYSALGKTTAGDRLGAL